MSTPTENVVAIDVGGTGIKGGRYDRSGSMQAEQQAATPAGSEAIVATIVEVARLLRTDRTQALGVVVPGVVDVEAGVARRAANLGWQDLALRAELSSELDLPVNLDHDVAAATLAESLYSNEDLLFVSLGTGVAAGHVVDGEVWRGATGRAGELGHICVVDGGERCGCGQHGCLEVYASATGIARRYVAAGGVVGLGSAEIAQRLNSDLIAAQVWAEAVNALATALATDVQIFDPACIVIGGGLAGARDLLLDPLTAALDRRLRWRSAPPIRLAALGVESGRRGAAELTWRMVDRPLVEQR
ncbi:glucokinase [Jatrophihabitans sp. GAS493]|uniref:ROK family protein n=1 Tax=Jatrophihabitans sp. GAS493 TaxID=1907575 RepID=UPI000BB76DF7|nr:ROK family protein [Jatrophihabitans sp. GAS493]SOD71708.1 glucokinase [Jatrophihabitans sp. GAS493]